MTKIIFFGTQEFAKGILNALIKSGNFEIIGVFTQPDRPAGRKQEIQKSPVKILAEKHGLKILQPENLKVFQMPNFNADLNIVCQYGLIIPQTILDSALKGSINIHTSLLPKYRGASPIQTAILQGEKETGVTIMLMDKKMDHGPILSQANIAIEINDTYLTLSEKMIPIANNLLLNTLTDYLTGELKPTEQNHDKATFCKIFTREDGKIDFNKATQEIYNQFRGLTPWPGIYTTFNAKRIKLLDIVPSDKKINLGKFKAEENKLFLGCKDNSVEIFKLQIEGKNVMDAKAFINGYLR